MIAEEARRRGSIDPGRPVEPPAGSAFARALGRAARRVTHGGGRARASRAMKRDVSRVLLIAPPSGSEGVVHAADLPPRGLVAVAESLHASGFQAEVYDATALSLGAESLPLRIEHSYPHVVAAATYAATSDAARDVLRAAKQAVPGVLTVLVSEQPTSSFGTRPTDAVVDFVVSGDCAETLPRLLVRLRTSGETRESQPRDARRDGCRPDLVVP